jgi:hypothetical protein
VEGQQRIQRVPLAQDLLLPQRRQDLISSNPSSRCMRRNRQQLRSHSSMRDKNLLADLLRRKARHHLSSLDLEA